MRATALVEMLLEMNVLNPGDFERKVDILAADINDQTLAQWFSRTVKYVFQNMDELTKRSHRPVPKEWLNMRGVHGTAHPFVSTDLEDLPVGSMSKNLLTMLASREGTGSAWWKKEPTISKRVTPHVPVRPTAERKAEIDAEIARLRANGENDAADAVQRRWNSEVENERNAAEARLRAAGMLGREEEPSKEAGVTGLGYYDPVAQSDWERWQAGRGEAEKAQAERFANVKPYKPKRKAKKAVEDALIEAGPQGNFVNSPAFKALKTAVDKKAEPDEVQRTLTQFMTEIGATDNEVRQALSSHKPQEKLVQLLRTKFGQSAEQLPNVALQALRGAAGQLSSFSTKLHQPGWKQHISQEYKRFTPTTTGPGLPFTPPKEVPAWMQKNAEQGGSPEAFYFDPLRTQDRQLWNGLENLVSYLNYMAVAKAELAASDVAEERADAEEAVELFSQLETGKTADFDLFLNTYAKAQNFAKNVPSIMLRRTMRLIGRYDDLELYELNTPEAVQTFANRPRWEKGEPEGGSLPVWCTKGIDQARNYLGYANGLMYGIQKEGKPYVLLAPGTRCDQIMDPNNWRITPEHLEEIAPLLAKIPNSKLQYLRMGDNHPLLEPIKQYRRANGLRDIP